MLWPARLSSSASIRVHCGAAASQLLVGLHVEGADLDQARVHPFVEQLDRLALAGAFHAVDQDDHREAPLLLQLELRLQQGLAQGGQLFIVCGLIDLAAQLGVEVLRAGACALAGHGEAVAQHDDAEGQKTQ